MKLNNRGSWSLIGLLVAVVIVVVVAAVYMGGPKGTGPATVQKDSALLDSKSKKNTVFGQAIDTGKASECKQRLGQIRLGVENYKAMQGTEHNPPNLRALGLSVSGDYFQCPVSSQPYTYDAAVGTVKCPTHTDF